MSKIMLVEDDNNLREIYGARLMAEGYEIVSAADGEEALALAVKEKPDLIISDVMMPKISGFDMLDILRTTPETKDTKVIMMTALSQPEDRQRGESLGADRYLVKSQVTLEDVVNTVHDIMGDGQKQSEPASPAPADATSAPTQEPASTPPVEPVPPHTTPPPSQADKIAEDEQPKPASTPRKVISPIDDGGEKKGIMELAAEEEAKERGETPPSAPAPSQEQPSTMAESAAEQKATMETEVQSLVDQGVIEGEANKPQVSPAQEPVAEATPADATPTPQPVAPPQAEAPAQEAEQPPAPKPPVDPNAPNPNDIAL